jgi:hypothetical protein
MATADVGDLRPSLQLFPDALKRRNPFVDQMAVVAGPEEALGAPEEAGAVFVPAEPAAGAKGIHIDWTISKAPPKKAGLSSLEKTIACSGVIPNLFDFSSNTT